MEQNESFSHHANFRFWVECNYGRVQIIDRRYSAVRFGLNVLHGGESVTDSAKSINDFPVEASIPDSTVSLESILCTNELRRRQSRPPDYKKENNALVALLSALVDSPAEIVQTLAETILDVTQCDSSGVSLLTKDGKRFYWPAIAGMWNRTLAAGRRAISVPAETC